MAKHLRAVEPGESAPAPILTLSEAVESGDYLAILRAQRRDIVTSLPDEKGPAKAALHRQLSMISKEIETLTARPDPGAVVPASVDDRFDASAI